MAALLRNPLRPVANAPALPANYVRTTHKPAAKPRAQVESVRSGAYRAPAQWAVGPQIAAAFQARDQRIERAAELQALHRTSATPLAQRPSQPPGPFRFAAFKTRWRERLATLALCATAVLALGLFVIAFVCAAS